jgi:V8-like Glu-specific endopeptidase
MQHRLHVACWLCIIATEACNAAVILAPNGVIPKQTVGTDQGATLFKPLESGEPLDLDNWINTSYENREQAMRALEASNSSLETTPIRNPLTRPSLYAALTDIDAEEKLPVEWHKVLNGKRQLLSTVVRSVGRIEVRNLGQRDYVSWVVGTAFVVAPQLVMTNQHVARQFYDFDNKKFIMDPQSRMTAEVSINFAGVRNNPSAIKRFPIVEVIYPSSRSDFDIALLRFDASEGDAPPALSLQENRPTTPAGRSIVVCGYPVDDFQYFRIPAVKRIAPGMISSVAPVLVNDVKHPILYHDASTSKGSSGSPVVDLDSGKVFGVHGVYFDKASKSNQAEPMWDVLSIPEVRSTLGLDQPTMSDPTPPVSAIKIPRPSILLDSANEGDPILAKTLSALLGKPSAHSLEELSMSGRNVVAVRSAGQQYSSSVGTGFRIGEKFIVAPAASSESEEQVEVSFDKTFDVGAPSYRSARVIERSASVPEALGANFMLLEVEMEDEVGMKNMGQPLTIDAEPAKPGRIIHVVGYPEGIGGGDIERTVFQGPLGMKRAAPGKILKHSAAQPHAIIHDASTATGSMGSPLLDASTGHLLGIHVGGVNSVGNFAIPIANVGKIFPLHAEQIFAKDHPR